MSGIIADLPPIEAPSEILQAARETCAARIEARAAEAARAIRAGEDDGCFAMRHELSKMELPR
jgi:hypothetical protein